MARLVVLFILFLGLCMLVQGSHLRSAIISWKAVGPNTANITLLLGLRHSYSPRAVGASSPQSSLNFGDGTSMSVPCIVNSISLEEDYSLVVGTVTKTYLTPLNNGNPWKVYFSQSSRLSTLKNNANVIMYVETMVDLTDPTNASPVSSGFSKLSVEKGKVFSIPISATDLYDRPLSFRLSTAFEVTNSVAGTQPGNLTVDSNTGVISWDTTYAAAGLWSTQIMIINSVSKTPVDFLIEVLAPVRKCGVSCGNAFSSCSSDSDCSSCTDSTNQCVSNTAPSFVAPTPPFGSFFCVTTPGSLSITVSAQDYTITKATRNVTLLTGSIPTGAIMSTPAGTDPTSATFSWTPTPDQTGKYSVCFSAMDDALYMTTPVCIFITVNSPPAPPVVSSATPDEGNILGGSTITIVGSGFTNSADILAKSNLGVTSTCTYLTPTSVKCISPTASASGGDTIAITCACNVYSNTWAFSYFDPPTISAVNPYGISQNTPVALTFTGDKMHNGALAPTCKISFNDTVVPATYVSVNEASCTVPAMTKGRYTVAVSNEGIHYSNTLPFVVSTEPTLTAVNQWEFIVPNTATDVVLLGSDFDPPVSCTVDGQSATVVYVNDTAIICQVASPGLTVGTHSVVASNPLSGASSAFPFYVMNRPQPTQIVPSYFNKNAGVTAITVSGSFISSNTLKCKVDGANVPVSYVDASTVVCSPTVMPALGMTTVEVANDAVHYESLQLNVVLLSPSAGPTVGGTTITISGKRSPAPSTGTCKFGTLPAAPYTSTSGTDNSRTVVCTVPAAAADGSVTLRLSGDGDASDVDLPFLFYAEPTLSAIEPASLTSLSGGVITITGSSFTDPALGSYGLAGSMTCQIVSGAVKSVVSAQLIDSTHVTCPVSARNSGSWDVSVSLVNEYPTTLPATTLPIYDVLTNFVGISTGGAQVTISGNFVDTSDTFACLFGNVSVVGTRFDASNIVCSSPAQPAGNVTVSVARNGGVWTPAVGQFTVLAVGVLSNPYTGSLTGDQALTISGRTFLTPQQQGPDAEPLICRFGTSTSNATINADGDIVCPIPASAAEGEIVLQLVDQNGWASSWNFSYYDVPQMEVAPFSPKQDNMETLNITVSCRATGLRPAKLSYSCKSCEFVVPDAPAARSQHVNSRMLVPSAKREMVYRNNVTIDFVVQAPYTLAPLVMYRPLPGYYGNDTVVVVGHVDNLPIDLKFASNMNVVVLALNRAPGFDASQLAVSASTGDVTRISGWASNIQAGSVEESAQNMWFVVTPVQPDYFTVQPTVDRATGDLVFTGAPAAAGLSTVINVVLKDNGGALFGGVDESSITAVTISFTSASLAGWIILIIALLFIGFVMLVLCYCYRHKFSSEVTSSEPAPIGMTELHSTAQPIIIEADPEVDVKPTVVPRTQITPKGSPQQSPRDVPVSKISSLKTIIDRRFSQPTVDRRSSYTSLAEEEPPVEETRQPATLELAMSPVVSAQSSPKMTPKPSPKVSAPVTPQQVEVKLVEIETPVIVEQTAAVPEPEPRHVHIPEPVQEEVLIAEDTLPKVINPGRIFRSMRFPSVTLSPSVALPASGRPQSMQLPQLDFSSADILLQTETSSPRESNLASWRSRSPRSPRSPRRPISKSPTEEKRVWRI